MRDALLVSMCRIDERDPADDVSPCADGIREMFDWLVIRPAIMREHAVVPPSATIRVVLPPASRTLRGG